MLIGNLNRDEMASRSTWKDNYRLVLWRALVLKKTVSAGNVLIYLSKPECVVTLKAVHYKLWKSDWEQAKFKYWKVSLSFVYPLCLNTKSWLNTHMHLRAVSLSVLCKLNPQLWRVQILLARLFILRIFQGHIGARLPYIRGHRGALWFNCDSAPTFRGLLRGAAEENTGCHCCIAPMPSDMISWQTAVQLWPSSQACWKRPLITSIVWRLVWVLLQTSIFNINYYLKLWLYLHNPFLGWRGCWVSVPHVPVACTY